jgi:hypothetical protein
VSTCLVQTPELAGEAMKLWGESADSQSVNVIGFTDNIEMVNLAIGTYHTVLTARTGGRVIGVFHNMVRYGKGKSINVQISAKAMD